MDKNFKLQRMHYVGQVDGKNSKEFSDKESMNLEIIKNIMAVIGLFFFVGCAVANASVFIRWVVQKKTGSMIPFIGGIVGCLALIISSWSVAASYWWIPFVLDTSFAMCILGIIRRLLGPNGNRKSN